MQQVKTVLNSSSICSVNIFLKALLVGNNPSNPLKRDRGFHLVLLTVKHFLASLQLNSPMRESTERKCFEFHFFICWHEPKSYKHYSQKLVHPCIHAAGCVGCFGRELAQKRFRKWGDEPGARSNCWASSKVSNK